jgi:hypothetical protein
MAIDKNKKNLYDSEVKDVKRDINSIRTAIKDIKIKMKGKSNIEAYYNLEIALLHMKNIDNFLKMNNLSLRLLDMRQSAVLDEAKKELSNLIMALENIVGNEIERPLKENDEHLAKIARLSPRQILALMKKVNYMFVILKEEFGEGSKWKWAFVEIQARIAVIIKNIISFADIQKYRDPRAEYYYERLDLMQLCKDSITEGAKQYRTKYEMAGKARDDLKRSIELLETLRNIHAIFGERDEANKLKTTIDAARQNLEAEDKSTDEKKKK